MDVDELVQQTPRHTDGVAAARRTLRAQRHDRGAGCRRPRWRWRWTRRGPWTRGLRQRIRVRRRVRARRQASRGLRDRPIRRALAPAGGRRSHRPRRSDRGGRGAARTAQRPSGTTMTIGSWRVARESPVNEHRPGTANAEVSELQPARNQKRSGKLGQRRGGIPGRVIRTPHTSRDAVRTAPIAGYGCDTQIGTSVLRVGQ